MIHIATDGSGDFRSVGQALACLPPDREEEIVFFIHKGIYKEQIVITRPRVTLLGESKAETILTFDLYARMTMADGGKRGTFRTYSCLVDTHDVTFKNLTLANSAGPGPKFGQALALYADGDRLMFDNCRFLGNQDTLFTGPLPPTEVEPGGFVGPKEFAPRVNGRHYYRNCYMEGDIDFIFGGATAYFEGCEFFSKDIGQPVNGYVTAASTPFGQPYGYVMRNCRFTSECPPGTVYLGRPWRDYAKTVLISCYMDRHICPEGWHDWNKLSARQNCFFAEYQSFGPGADINARPCWTRRLSDQDLPLFSPESVLSGDDGWSPWR